MGDEMSNILYIGNNFGLISSMFGRHNVLTLNTPEDFRFDEKDIIKSSSGIDLNEINLIFCELPSSVLVLLKLIKESKYEGPVILVPHLNPYPLRNLLSILVFLQNTIGQSVIVCGSDSSAIIYKRLFGVNPLVLPTYGIEKNIFNKKEKGSSRKRLGLGKDAKVLLYTGRIAPDKNIGGVFAIYDSLCKDIPDLKLVITYNRTIDVYIKRLVFQWKPDDLLLLNLDTDKLPYVYSASDLFVSCSTSYFETFGRSPLEANACGIPAIVPNWIGFSSYINSVNGKLVDVDFFEEQLFDDKNYSMVNLELFAEVCKSYLDRDNSNIDIDEYLTKDNVYSKYMSLISALLEQNQFTQDISEHMNYTYRLSPEVEDLLDRLKLKAFDNILDAIKTNSNDPMTDAEYKELFYLTFKEAANRKVC